MSSTIHFQIEVKTKRLAMRPGASAEEHRHQSSKHEGCLEEQIALAFSRYNADEGEYISNDDMKNRMNTLKQQAMRSKL